MVSFRESDLNGEIFRDREKLFSDYVPATLVDREEEFKKLVRMFKPFLQNGTSQRVSIYGERGSGKTALGRRFGRELENYSNNKNIDLNYAYVDCRKYKNSSRIAWRLANVNNVSVPRSGISTFEFLEALKKHMKENGYLFLIILDWIDFHVRQEGSDLLYSLTRLWENSTKPNRIGLVGISRSPDLSFLMDRATSSTFLHNNVELEKYTVPEIGQILRKRTETAFKPNAVMEETIDLIAKNSVLHDGAGFAIEWLHRAGLMAAEKNDEKVRPEHALNSKNRVYARISIELLNILNRHEILILLAFAKKTKNRKENRMRTGDLWKEYKKVCKSYNEEPECFSNFSKLVGELSNLYLIEAMPTGGGGEGNTRIIKLSEKNPSLLESIFEYSSKIEKKRMV